MVRDINMLGTRLDKKTIELGKELPPPDRQKAYTERVSGWFNSNR